MSAKLLLLSFALLMVSGCSIHGVYIAEQYRHPIGTVPADSIDHSLFLIGDAGEPNAVNPEPTFLVLSEYASHRPDRSTIVFLGDNIYPRGLPETGAADRPEMERRLLEQIRIAEKSGAAAIFVPGNHDWEYQRENGIHAIRREQDFIDSLHLNGIRLLPRDGLPGPAVVDIGTQLRVIAIDTQWWLHQYSKPFYTGVVSEHTMRSRFLDSLERAIRSADGRNVVVAAHHPLETYGEHGGFFDWKDHLFPLRKIIPWMWLPLPGIGSLYPVSRMLGISDQDLAGSRNGELRGALDSLFSNEPILAYAAGHEHTLQVLTGKNAHLNIVSGKGIEKHSEALTVGAMTIAATRHTGFQRMDFLHDGRVRLGMIDCSSGAGVEVFSMWLR